MRRYVVVLDDRHPNPLAGAFTDRHGIVHPLRGSDHYSQSVQTAREHQRELLGITSREDQQERREDAKLHRAAERYERRGPIEEKLYHLRTERDALKERLAGDAAAKLTHLIRQRGRDRGEVNLIPLAQAERITHKRITKVNIVEKAGHKYVPWEYYLDTLAEERGYRDGDALRQGIERAQRDKKKLARLDVEIRDVRAQLGRRRNPAPSLWDRFKSWLARG